MRDGAVNYLAKPIDLDELLASVRKATGMERAPLSVLRQTGGSAGQMSSPKARSRSRLPRCRSGGRLRQPNPHHRRKRRGQGNRRRRDP